MINPALAQRNGKARLRRAGRKTPAGSPPETLKPWLRDQVTNLTRHAAALRPFRQGEFGPAPPGPSIGHLNATNELITNLRNKLLRLSGSFRRGVLHAFEDLDSASLQRLLKHKSLAHSHVKLIEKVWQFYFEIFSQRQTQIGPWLLACDRISLDCYQTAWLGLGRAKSVPAPGPFTLMKTGRSPATYRRGLLLRRLSRQPNPFPLIELPYHRLVNPWTLGAIPHEVCHNLQNDLDLQDVIPKAIAARLRHAGLSNAVAGVWSRWNRETFADLLGLLLGGPQVVPSLLDVIGRAPQLVTMFNPRGVHPTPYLRAWLSFELLRRMGFGELATRYRDQWQKLYPRPETGSIPREVLRTAARAVRLVVDAVCYQPYRTLGDKPLSCVVTFGENEQHMIEEAAGRLAAGTNPGIIPERFLIGAARTALDRGLARPGVITTNFYLELGRR